MNSDNGVNNPWHSLPQHGDFVLPDDAASVNEFNRQVEDEFKVRLEILPEPFIGSKVAPVVLLNLNPGFTRLDIKFHKDHAFRKLVRSNLTHAESDYPFYLLDPSFDAPGTRWWKRKLRHVIDAVGLQVVAQSVLCVEYFPYHSRRFAHGKLSLASQQYSFSLVRNAIDRGAFIILMRGRKHWLKQFSELTAYPSFHTVSNPRNPAISPRNGPAWFDELVKLIADHEISGNQKPVPRGKITQFEFEGPFPGVVNDVIEFGDDIHRGDSVWFDCRQPGLMVIRVAREANGEKLYIVDRGQHSNSVLFRPLQEDASR